jgi:Na+/melibiose symporter-like transporter
VAGASDRTRTPWGRPIPYVLFGGLPFALAFALLFTAPFDGRSNPAGLLLYFGMRGFLITLSGLLVASVFGLLMPAFDYDTLLDVQPASVDLGFRIFLTVPTSIGFLLAIFLLWPYSLHGRYLKEIKDNLKAKRDAE